MADTHAVAQVAFALLVDGAKIVMGMKSAAEVESNMAAVARAHTVPRALFREAQALDMLSPQLPI